MPISLDHLIVPTKNRVEAARRLANVLGVSWSEQAGIGPFSPVFVSPELTLDFDEWPEPVPMQHYCFKVSEQEFDEVLARIKVAGLPYRSTPIGEDDFKVGEYMGGRVVYWRDPDGHAWEILTVSYARQSGASTVSAA